MEVLLVLIGFVAGGLIGGAITYLSIAHKIRKQTVWGAIRLIGVNEETTQYDAGVIWPEPDVIAKHKYVVLEVTTTQK